jgi:hypothetical protein
MRNPAKSRLWRESLLGLLLLSIFPDHPSGRDNLAVQVGGGRVRGLRAAKGERHNQSRKGGPD